MVSWKQITWSWFWLYLIAVIAVLLQPTTPTVYFGYYSQTSFIILVTLLIGVIPAFFMIRLLANRIETLKLPSLIHALSLLMMFLLIGIGWFINLGPTPSYMIIRLIGTFVILSIVAWHLTYLPKIIILKFLSPILLIGSLIIIYWLGLDYPGLLWTDEGFMLSVGRGFTEMGQPIVTFLGPAIRESFSLVYIIIGYFNRLFGGDYDISRLYILSIGMLAIAILAIALKLRYSTPIVLMVVTIGILSIININYLRQDVGVAVYLSIAFLTYVIAEKTNKIFLHLIVGLFLGFSLDGHPVAYRFCLGVGIAYIIEAIYIYRSQKILDWRACYLLAGGITGVAIYYLFYASITDTFTSFLGSSTTTFNGIQSVRIAGVHLFHMADSLPLLLLGAIFGSVLSLRLSNSFNRMLMITSLVSIIIVTTFYGPLRSHYIHHMMPILLLLTAEGLSIMEKFLNQGKRDQIFVGLMLACTIAMSGYIAQKLQTSRSQSYDAIHIMAQEMREIVSDEDTIVGVDPMFFAFYDHPNFYEIAAGQYNSRVTDMSQSDYWEALAPDYIVVVNGYPLIYPDALQAYIAQSNFVETHCWENRVTSRVQLLHRHADNPTSPIICTQVSQQ